MSLERVSGLVRQGATDDEIAAELTHAEVLALVGRYTQDVRRAVARQAERAVSVGDIKAGAVCGAEPNQIVRIVNSPQSAIERLAASTFPGVDGRMVSWAEATVADHEARIAALTVLVRGAEATIARHRAAVVALKAAEVAA